MVKVKGTNQQIKFPDHMSPDSIREVMRNKYYSSINNPISVPKRYQTVEPVDKTLMERAGQGIGEFLTDKGLISNPYSAQEFGRGLVGIGDFLPVIGDASAGDDFGRSLAQGDKLGMAMAGLGVIPVAGDLVKGAAKSTLGAGNRYLSDDIYDMPDKARERAKEIGFMPDMRLYHGTNTDIDAFDVSKLGQATNSPTAKQGIFVALDRDVAKYWADNAVEKGGGEPRVLELVHRAEKPAAISLEGSESPGEIAATISAAWEDGFDSLMLKNVIDTDDRSKKWTYIIVKDPSQLRRPDAKFDKKSKLSSGLMAGVGGLVAYRVSSEDDPD